MRHSARLGAVVAIAIGVGVGGSVPARATRAGDAGNEQYAGALLWPYQSGTSSGTPSGSGGSGTSTRAASDLPRGALAILSGQGGNLNYIVHARFLQPKQSYSVFLGDRHCGGYAVGPSRQHEIGSAQTSVYEGWAIHDSLGRQQASAAGTITLYGKLGAALVPTLAMKPGRQISDPSQLLLSVYVQAHAPSGAIAYCGDVQMPQSVIALRAVNGSRAEGMAIISRGVTPWWKGNGSGSSGGNSRSNGNDDTQVVVFAHGLKANTAYAARIVAGACGAGGSTVRIPLSGIQTNGLGAGVSGTLLDTKATILHTTGATNRTERQSLVVDDAAHRALACGTLA